MLPLPPNSQGDSVPPSPPLDPRRITRGPLTLEISGEYHAAVPRPKDWLELTVSEIAASCKRIDQPSKAYPTPAVAAIAQRDRKLCATIANVISDAMKGGGPVEFGERIGHAIITYTMLEAKRLGVTKPSPSTNTDHRGAA